MIDLYIVNIIFITYHYIIIIIINHKDSSFCLLCFSLNFYYNFKSYLRFVSI